MTSSGDGFMHIALLNGYPRLVATAEVEFIKRFIIAAQRQGHRAFEVVTSDDIEDCQPDFVLATSEFSPKLTSYLTLGALWSPPVFYKERVRVRAILSYDAYLLGSEDVHRFLDDLEFSTGVRKPRADFTFLPGALATPFEPSHRAVLSSLCYIGVHWDGARHAPLLRLLGKAGLLNVYGPPAAWSDYARQYRGPLPFDGQAVQTTLRRHGIALCLHREEHRQANTPSMRLFEAAAAGCLLIVDEIPFARQFLGNSAFHIDLRREPEANAQKIGQIVRWANAHPQAANAMRRESHRLLSQQFALDALVNKCCAFVGRVKANIAAEQRHALRAHAATFRAPDDAPIRPIVDVIVRAGGRSTALLKRAVASVEGQTEGQYRILLVDYKNRADIRAFAKEFRSNRIRVEYFSCLDTGARSTALWTGLRNVTAPFFANLDDDDTLSPHHFASLLKVALEHPEHDLYYSGAVRVEEAGHYVNAPNFGGPLEIEVAERRELVFLEPFSLSRLIAGDNFICSNAYLARSICLDERTLEDPHLVVGDDVYLLYMLARRRPFRMCPYPTAFWHWRSTRNDNSMLAVDRETWSRDGHRVYDRLEQEVFYNGMSLGSLRALALHGDENHAARWWPFQATPIPPGVEKILTGDVVLANRQRNFNVTEPSGVWSLSTDATLRVWVSERVTDIRVRIKFQVAGQQEQIVRMTLNGQPFFAGAVPPWTFATVERRLQFMPATDSLFVRVYCDRVFNPSKEIGTPDTRNLGVFLSTLSFVKCARVKTDGVGTEYE